MVAWHAIHASVACAGEPEDSQHLARQPDAERFFSERVLPVLRDQCFECHSHASDEASGGLMLDSLVGITTGGSRGSALEPEHLPSSLLLRSILYQDESLQMPPSGKLPDSEIAALRTWIEQGANVPPQMRGQIPTNSESQPLRTNPADHWAYRAPLRWHNQVVVQPPEVANFIDSIVLKGLHAAGLSLSPPANRDVLLRRLSYDLSGLPVSPPALRRMLDDPRDTNDIVREWSEQLLASPSFGERWARHWMDVSRYADNKGYVFKEDREYAEAFKYRDWLIDAFNTDMPYDQFVSLQLAADLLVPEKQAIENSETETNANLPALGFLTLGRRFLNNQHDIIDDRLDVITRGLMGMTLACARCHDHKYDPVSQADYYALFGVLLNTDEPGGGAWPHRLADSTEDRASHVLIRGSPRNQGEQVDRRFVALLAPDKVPFSIGSGRSELAAKIVDPQNPLTARVFANRVWMQLTGTSLVESPSDFGLRCGPPKQAELLDQLAIELIQSGWSLKQLIRTIVSSGVYQQSSDFRAEAYEVDAENSLYWRMNRRRLDFEALRDTLLSRAGELDPAMYGKSQPIDTTPLTHRRTVYAYIDRQNLPPVFRTFDLASPDTHSPMRAQTSVPQQGLYLLNSDFVAKISQQLAGRSLQVSGHNWRRVVWLFEQVCARTPSDVELSLALGFVEAQSRLGAADSSNEFGPLAQLAASLLATNEIAYLD